MVVELEHPTAGAMRNIGVPVKLSSTPGAVRTPAPRLGQHTDEVLAEYGYKAGEIARFRERRVVGYEFKILTRLAGALALARA